MPKNAKHGTLIDPVTAEILVDEETKARQWTFLIYPGDSAPDDWRVIIEQLLVPYAVGPLHVGEISTKTGEIEKDHRHVILLFPSTKGYKQMYRLSHNVLHGTVPMPIHDLNLQTRYLIHLDQPEKKPYDRSEIIAGNLFDLDKYLAPPRVYNNQLMMAMVRFIQREHVTELIDFMDFCMEHEPAWFDLLVNSKTNVFDKAIRSNRGKIQTEKKIRADLEAQYRAALDASIARIKQLEEKLENI